MKEKYIGIWVLLIGCIICFIIFKYPFDKQSNLKQQIVENSPTLMETDNDGELQKEIVEDNNVETDSSESLMEPSGTTLDSRFLAPSGYTKDVYIEGSFGAFVREYPLKEDGAKVHLYDGGEKSNQSVVEAVFDMHLGEQNLQQCADSVIRMYAEYFYKSKQYERMKFHFVNGFACTYQKWMEGYRVKINQNTVSWQKTAQKDNSSDIFEKYLNIVFSYASTLSLNQESKKISFNDVSIGDIFISAGSPGHVVMVVDVCTNEQGKKAVLLAQGYMPAQDFHVIKNRNHIEDPWYYQEEIDSPFYTAEYTFPNNELRRLEY